MTRIVTALAALACLGLIAMATTNRSAHAGDDPLRALRWSMRPVIVFVGEGPERKKAERQLALLADQRDGLGERDIALLIVDGDSVRRDAEVLGGAAALRRRFGIGPQGFALVLVGKDGGEKRRETAPVRPESLFATIDAMPMRRREMREGG